MSRSWFAVLLLFVIAGSFWWNSNLQTRNEIRGFQQQQNSARTNDCVYGVMRDAFALKFWSDRLRQETAIAKVWVEIQKNGRPQVKQQMKDLIKIQALVVSETAEYVDQIRVSNKEHLDICHTFLQTGH
jgi:hypothetical protein